MATYKFVDVQIKEARYLADLTGIQLDLQGAKDLCERLLKLDIYKREDSELLEVFTIAILVKYSRAFAKGVRKYLSVNDLQGLTDDELRQHNGFIELRNKHIAHSVNEFEENKVVARYNDEKVYDEGVTSISVQQTRLISLSGSDAEAIIALSAKILDYVNEQMKAEKAKVLDIVRSQPIMEVLKSGSSAFKNPDMTKVSKKRNY